MNSYLNENNVKSFLKKTMATSINLLIELDRLKKNKESEEQILKIEKEVVILNKLFETVNEYSEYCGYTKS
jgi:hypothetical protein